MQSDTYQEILEEGEERGLAKGEKRGLLRLRQLVNRQIARRFPEAAPQIAPLLDRCSAEDLEEVGDAVLTAASAQALQDVIEARIGGIG